MILKTFAYPRAALIGNPSDGYFGKTIAFTFSDFRAEALIYESPELVIEPAARDGTVFDSAEALVGHISKFGYYGGVRLVKAAVKCLHDYVVEHGLDVPRRNFTIRYSTDIPDLVGLAGSSAIVTACVRAIMAFYKIDIPPPALANLIRDVENKELGIPAGLQDRVAQVYQGLVYMDFDRGLLQSRGYGRYESLPPDLMPPLYIAYRTDLSEGSEVFHNAIRERFNAGDKEVVDAMNEWADMTDRALDAMKRHDYKALSAVMDANFDLRAHLYQLSEGNLRMVSVARECGASAKFSGSGGAIVGVCPDDMTFDRLHSRLGALGVKVFRPKLAL